MGIFLREAFNKVITGGRENLIKPLLGPVSHNDAGVEEEGPDPIHFLVGNVENFAD